MDLSIENLSKTYPNGVQALKNVSLTIPHGMFGLLGPNGAGKSTTIGMLTTTVEPTSGTARLAGYDVVAQPLQARSVSSVVYQESVVDRGLSGRANLELHAQLWGVKPATAATQIAELSEALGVAELLDRNVETYSGGESRRLEIARALVSSPRVLFLDEPTVGLDPRIRLDEAERLCDRVAIIHSGEIVALDTPGALLAGLGREVLELRVHGDTAVALAALGVHGVSAADALVVGQTLTIPLHEVSATEAIAAINLAGVETSAISSRRPTLDDVYLRVTGEGFAAAA